LLILAGPLRTRLQSVFGTILTFGSFNAQMRTKSFGLTLCSLASMVIGGSSIAMGGDSPRVSPELLDYLIQDVCVDSSDRAKIGDPAVCKSHRNLRVGEALPYILTDFDPIHGLSYQSVSSVPVLGTDHQLKVLVVKILQGNFTQDFHFSFSNARDGFDLIDVGHSNYASIVRTYDPGCHDQLFSRNSRVASLADRSGGWVLFPLAEPPSELAPATSLHLTTWRVQLSPGGVRCASNHATGITVWYRPTPYTFRSGKKLTTLRTDHFAAEDLAQPENSFERFYFTREYGLTRWESWWTLAFCEKTLVNAAGRCVAGPDGEAALCGAVGKLEQQGGQTWVRMDCRDFTRYLPLARAQLPVSSTLANGDGIRDIDYSATLEGR
jgi:hypothetical protein